jgi:hypothetical protein
MGGTPGITCDTDDDCNDLNPCNGTETCQSGTCADGADTIAEGQECAEGSICVSGTCRAQCSQDDDCDDQDLCNGQETCSPTTLTCQSGMPLACDDGDACTENSCDSAQGCFYPLIDQDGDGHADEALGACGDDCDDGDETVFTEATELCDGKDNNCNGDVDETAPRWYLDCDGDGYAATGATEIQQCNRPTDVSSCAADLQPTADWTSVAPGAGTTDCYDASADHRPMTATESNSAWSATGTASAPAAVDFDFNCDGQEEPRYTTTSVATDASCALQCTDGTMVLCACSGPSGWTGSTVPACGANPSYTSCGGNMSSGCARTTGTSRSQECR